MTRAYQRNETLANVPQPLVLSGSIIEDRRGYGLRAVPQRRTQPGDALLEMVCMYGIQSVGETGDKLKERGRKRERERERERTRGESRNQSLYKR